jgi:hypothetical protein
VIWISLQQTNIFTGVVAAVLVALYEEHEKPPIALE